MCNINLIKQPLFLPSLPFSWIHIVISTYKYKMLNHFFYTISYQKLIHLVIIFQGGFFKILDLRSILIELYLSKSETCGIHHFIGCHV